MDRCFAISHSHTPELQHVREGYDWVGEDCADALPACPAIVKEGAETCDGSSMEVTERLAEGEECLAYPVCYELHT